MPLYEYECPNCEHEFSAFRSVADRRIARCPKCSELADKLLSICVGSSIDSNIKDLAGNPVSWPGKPYYDRCLGKRVESKKHKQQIMKEKNLVMDGSSTRKEKII